MCLFRKKKKESGQHWATDLKTSDDWKLRERWEDYPAPDYNAVHTYCSVALEDRGRTYYYRTRNPDLCVGDLVYVPFGYKYEKKVGRIVKMKNYRGAFAPYPLEKTKHIIGQYEDE